MTVSSSAGGLTEAEAVMRLFGEDPWLRFDLWASRAWEAAQNAIAVSNSTDPSMNLDEGLDPRIIAQFHAAAVAKEFSEMVNPIIAVSDSKVEGAFTTADGVTLPLSMILDTEE